MTVDAFLERLDSVKATKAGSWQARCPGHEDRKASLSISTGDGGRVLLHCHAGCETTAILDALGLTTADLFAETKRESRIVAAYAYRDETGTLLYEVVRRDPKDFRQRRPDGAGGWIWKLDGVRRVVYRLHALATARPEAVFLVEGEKDADRLAKLGLPATCNPQGAGKWLDDYAAQLRACGVQRVAILPDHDAPGRAHAEQVAASCHEAGLEVRVVELPGLPEKGDVSDWLEAGGSKAALVALVKASPVWTPDDRAASSATPAGRRIRLTAASAIRVRPVRWLYTTSTGLGRVALGTLALVGGREGVGKSTYTYTLAAAVTRGRLPGVYRGLPKSVIIAATEDSWSHTIVPRLMAAEADLSRIFRVDVETSAGFEIPVCLPRDVAALGESIHETDAALVVLDPLLSRLDTGLDSHRDAEVRVALEPLVAIGDATGATMLGLIHVNKSKSDDALSLLMGSRAFAAVARSVLFVAKDPDDETVRLVGQPKNNLGRTDGLPMMRFQVVETTVAQTDEGPVKTGKLEWLSETDRTIQEVLESSGETDRKATTEAADWLYDFLTAAGGPVASQAVKKAAQAAGHALTTLNRARTKLRVHTESVGFPRATYWTLPQSSQSSHANSGESESTGTTGTTEAQPDQSCQSNQSYHSPREWNDCDVPHEDEEVSI